MAANTATLMPDFPMASQFGLTYLDAVFCGLTDGGVYTAVWTPTSSTTNGVKSGILM